jgi:hypothetical protein
MHVYVSRNFSGIMDGRYSGQELMQLVDSDDAFASIRAQLAVLDCLFIDEASMLSAYMFEQVFFFGFYLTALKK